MQFAHLPPYGWLLILCVLSLLLYRYSRLLFNMVFFVLLGMAWQSWHCQGLLSQQLASDDIGKDITVLGVVSGIPVCDTEHCQFQLATERVNSQAKSQVLQIGWYHIKKPVIVGQRWRFVVRLKPPFGSLNPGSFDAQSW
ncbi:MAG: DUF4131 domain-containing protein, partial [Pseudomonadota bacterium]|nr:DUF4131 domain-containing protein [Pseudomonadota bacterium]